MANILNIETATTVCSVSVSKNGETIALKESLEDKSHAKLISVFVQDVLKEANIKPLDLDAVAVSKGPGSYTGLRIGVSFAKGLAYAADLKFIAIHTLESLAYGAKQKHNPTPDTLICPMLDARRMEVYHAIYDQQLNTILPTEAYILQPDSYTSYLEKQKILFVGNAATKTATIIQHPNALFDNQIHLSATNMAQLAQKAYDAQQFEDLAYFEPNYLKEFMATIPKKIL